MNQIPKIKYFLGADDLVGEEQSLDCSSFIWRCCGERKFDGKRWRNTSWIYNDINTNNTKFIKVELKDIQQGDVIVYGWENKKVGHTGIIDKLDSKGNLFGYDCSSSKGGITYRNFNFFLKKKYLIGRYKK